MTKAHGGASMTQIIPLTQGKQTIVDDEDFEELSKFRWRCSDGGYVVRGYASKIKMHRVVIGAPIGMEVDHVNGYTLDNRKENLRLCTHAENGRNRKLNADNKSGYKGVSWDNKIGKWRVTIKANLHRIHLGYFADPVEAARVYDDAARKYYKEFSRTNF
jgi:hypothetical protein